MTTRTQYVRSVAESERNRSVLQRLSFMCPKKVSHDGPPESGAGHTRLEQRALFYPRGLFGLLYWYAVTPLHQIVFRGMLLGIEREALEIAAGPEGSGRV